MNNLLCLLLVVPVGLAPAPRSAVAPPEAEAPAAQEAQDPPPAKPGEEVDNPIQGNEITPEQQRAVERGLAFLASKQNADGSFGTGGGRGSGTAITALSAIAMMSAGNLPGRGQYGAHVSKAADYIISSSQPNGLLSETDEHGVMYAHGFATLFLGEVYGMTQDERVKDPLTRAVRLIQKVQNHEGGWRYTPAPFDADISVTITQVMALRAARDAGIKVEKSVIDKAVKYVESLQNPDGGFNYMAGSGNNSAFPRSAAGVATLYYAGIAEGKQIDAGLAYVERFTPGKGMQADTPHYYYGHYYAVQTMFLAGGEHWGTWYPAIREELIARQNPDGSWAGEVSPEYCTAMALIVLQMPNRYLPVFSGKGAGA
jgi:squalene cyclase